MISDVLRDFARALRGFNVGSTAIDEGTDFFARLLRETAQFVATAFGS